ncbi:MAG: hypothetical protein PUJ50_06145 [Bacteroidales bacterium]|nr:hypothetical protein [Bacteroidales bacterium]
MALWIEFTRTVSGTDEEADGDPVTVVRGTEVGSGIRPEEASDCTAEAVCGRDAGGKIGPEERDDCGAPGAETM